MVTLYLNDEFLEEIRGRQRRPSGVLFEAIWLMARRNRAPVGEDDSYLEKLSVPESEPRDGYYG